MVAPVRIDPTHAAFVVEQSSVVGQHALKDETVHVMLSCKPNDRQASQAIYILMDIYQVLVVFTANVLIVVEADIRPTRFRRIGNRQKQVRFRVEYGCTKTQDVDLVAQLKRSYIWIRPRSRRRR